MSIRIRIRMFFHLFVVGKNNAHKKLYKNLLKYFIIFLITLSKISFKFYVYLC
jgi:hypothetical protein